MPPAVAVLTGMDVMTGFAAHGEMYAIDSEEAARVMLTRFGSVFGLPKLVLIDDGSECKDLLIKTCDVLMIKYHVISKGNHKAVIVEQFHRHLNKVQRIHVADCQTLVDWLKGMVFAIYPWNASPVDRTDVIRSYAAIGHEFPFPVKLNLEQAPAIPGENTAELVMEHIDGSFPLLRHQQELLRILIDDR